MPRTGTAPARFTGQARWHNQISLHAYGRLERAYLWRGDAPKHRLSLLILLCPDGSGRSSRLPGAASYAMAVPYMLYAAARMPMRHTGAVTLAKTALRVMHCQHCSCATRGFKCGVQRLFIPCGLILRHHTARKLPQQNSVADSTSLASFCGLLCCA